MALGKQTPMRRADWLPVRIADWWVLAHVVVALSVAVLASVQTIVWVPVLWLLALHLVAAEHNHGHVATFRAPVANRLLDFALLLTTGIPMLCWRTVHRSEHHASPWTERDHSSPFRFEGARAPRRPVSYRRYQLTYLPRFVSAAVRHVRSRGDRRLKTELWLTAILFVSVQVLWIASFGLLTWFLVSPVTWLVCGCTLGAANYLQHWETHLGGDRHAAWTFTCRWHNLLNYNAGYHELHHRRPSLHWSELARTHRRSPGYCRSELLEEGLFPAYRGGGGLRAWFASSGLSGPRDRA